MNITRFELFDQIRKSITVHLNPFNYQYGRTPNFNYNFLTIKYPYIQTAFTVLVQAISNKLSGSSHLAFYNFCYFFVKLIY